MKLDFLITIFAQIFAKFKQKNPAVAGIIALVLMAVIYTANQGTLLGVFTIPEWASQVLTGISTLLLAVNGSSTSAYLPPGRV